MADIARQYRKHIVSAREVEEVHSTAPEYFKNEGEEKRAPVIMVGPTVSGRVLVVPMEPTHRTGVWHLVTAFEANTHHKAKYNKEHKS